MSDPLTVEDQESLQKQHSNANRDKGRGRGRPRLSDEVKAFRMSEKEQKKIKKESKKGSVDSFDVPQASPSPSILPLSSMTFSPLEGRCKQISSKRKKCVVDSDDLNDSKSVNIISESESLDVNLMVKDKDNDNFLESATINKKQKKNKRQKTTPSLCLRPGFSFNSNNNDNDNNSYTHTKAKPRKKPRTHGELMEQQRQRSAAAARFLTNQNEQLSKLTYKEKLLCEKARSVFARLGPDALLVMQSIVLGQNQNQNQNLMDKDNTSDNISIKKMVDSDSLDKNETFDTCKLSPMYFPNDPSVAVSLPVPGYLRSNTIPTLRALERFFNNVALQKGLAAYWRVCELPIDQTMVPPIVCMNDPYFRNSMSVWPSHMFAGQRRMVALLQRKYVDPNGRRVPLFGWPFPTTVCQAICFGWYLSEGILDRYRVIGAPPPYKNINRQKKNKNLKNEKNEKKIISGTNKLNSSSPSSVINTAALHFRESKAELYQYQWVTYHAEPVAEGCSPMSPSQALPLMIVTEIETETETESYQQQQQQQLQNQKIEKKKKRKRKIDFYKKSDLCDPLSTDSINLDVATDRHTDTIASFLFDTLDREMEELNYPIWTLKDYRNDVGKCGSNHDSNSNRPLLLGSYSKNRWVPTFVTNDDMSSKHIAEYHVDMSFRQLNKICKWKPLSLCDNDNNDILLNKNNYPSIDEQKCEWWNGPISLTSLSRPTIKKTKNKKRKSLAFSVNNETEVSLNTTTKTEQSCDLITNINEDVKTNNDNDNNNYHNNTNNNLWSVCPPIYPHVADGLSWFLINQEDPLINTLCNPTEQKLSTSHVQTQTQTESTIPTVDFCKTDKNLLHFSNFSTRPNTRSQSKALKNKNRCMSKSKSTSKYKCKQKKSKADSDTASVGLGLVDENSKKKRSKKRKKNSDDSTASATDSQTKKEKKKENETKIRIKKKVGRPKKTVEEKKENHTRQQLERLKRKETKLLEKQKRKELRAIQLATAASQAADLRIKVKKEKEKEKMQRKEKERQAAKDKKPKKIKLLPKQPLTKKRLIANIVSDNIIRNKTLEQKRLTASANLNNFNDVNDVNNNNLSNLNNNSNNSITKSNRYLRQTEWDEKDVISVMPKHDLDLDLDLNLNLDPDLKENEMVLMDQSELELQMTLRDGE
jgi:hypothetical protein